MSRSIRACSRRSIRCHGVSFLLSHGYIGLLTLGAVFLVVTGAEALYADLGHFGRGPIRTAWLTVVSAGAHHQLSRPGRAAARESRGDREPVLSALSRLGARSHGGARHRRHRDREPGRDHRRLFHHPPGDPARAPAAARDPPYLGSPVRPDLHPAREPAALARRALARGAVQVFRRARLRLRHRRDRHDGGDGDPRA